jgi:hypothetical protein
MATITWVDSHAELRSIFVDYFVHTERWDIVAVLQHTVIDTHYVGLGDDQEVVVSAVVPEHALTLLTSPGDRRVRQSMLWQSLFRAAGTFNYDGARFSTVALTVVTPESFRPESGINNCFFKTEKTIKHDELNFRSNPEITIYEELKKRDLLFFPNPAAILGGSEPDKREPDFLVCHKGKWGVLEVMGDTYHTNAAKDHNRGRLFKAYGLTCVEFFTADDCVNDPEAVVDRFLSILAKH